jgi:hypothetical protein
MPNFGTPELGPRKGGTEMKRHIGMAMLAGLLLVSVAVAVPPVNGGFGCFGPTIGLVNFDGLHAAFASGGITQPLASLQWGLGGAGFALIDRIVIGGSGWGGSQTVASDDLRASVEIGGGEFDLGYQVFSIKHLLIAPVLGIGGSGYTVELQKLSGDVPNFNELLQNPGRTSKVSFSSFSITPQLMVTVPISFVGLQLRGGYCYTPVNPAWELDSGGKLLTGPTISKGMPFATLNVVFGGFEGGTRRRGNRK